MTTCAPTCSPTDLPIARVARARRAVVALLAACSLLAACWVPPTEEPASEAAGSRLRIVASIPPLAWLVDRLGGDRVTTRVLLPPGSTPNTYEPSPRQVVALDRAHLVVAVGHPDFPFERRLSERLLAHRPELPRVTATAALEELALPHGHDHRDRDHGDPDTDPHVWVAPDTMAALAVPVAEALIGIDPAHAETYRHNLAALQEEIEGLDRELASRLEDLPRRRFWVYHPAWGYLARQYGLEQVALEVGGKELGPKRLVGLVERARRDGVTVVFVQRGFSDRAARALAAEAGARVEVLDPLAYDWPQNLRSVASRLADALAADGPADESD